jgi:hypothetical protein
MSTATETVFLLDVDNTLLDNDGVITDLSQHLEQDSATRIGTDIGESSKHCVMNLAMRTIWAPYNAIVLAR